MTGWQPQPSSIGPAGEYAGRAETFIISNAQHASTRERAYFLSWRPCTVWERPVLDRAYARLAAEDAARVTVTR